MDYQATLQYLDTVQARGIKLGLQNMTSLLDALEDPQDSFPAIVVGGTNGKGSVSAFAASILARAGYRTGLYTSPHLVRYEERIQVNGHPITPSDFARAVTIVSQRIDEMLARGALVSHPTHFEVLTAAAFVYFHAQEIQVAVLEVGMGGRLDAVALARTVVAVITNIDLEHTKYLGDTVEAIAREKAGIIREGCDVVTAETKPEALQVIRREASGRGVHLIERHESARVTHAASAASGRFQLETSRASYGDIVLPLAGRHQVENATLAVLAVEALADAELSDPIEITREAMVEGLTRAHWPGRLQLVGHRPLMILDGAHNPAGAHALARALRDMGESGAWEHLWMIFAALVDKEIEPMARELFPLADRLIVTRGRSERFRDPAQLAELARNLGISAMAAASCDEAIRMARGQAAAGDAICLCGSLYLIGDAMEALGIEPYA